MQHFPLSAFRWGVRLAPFRGILAFYSKWYAHVVNFTLIQSLHDIDAYGVCDFGSTMSENKFSAAAFALHTTLAGSWLRLCPLLWRQCLWLYWSLLQELLYKALCSWRLQHPPRHLGHKIILTYLHCRGNLLCTLAMIMITRFHTCAKPNLSIFFHNHFPPFVR